MTAAARLLDAIVHIVRTRLPRGVDVDYLDDSLDQNRFALEAVIEQNLGPALSRMQAANNAAFVQEDIPDPERSGGGRTPPRAAGDEEDVRFWTVAKRTAANGGALAVGDLDGDGQADLAVGGAGSGTTGDQVPGCWLFAGPLAAGPTLADARAALLPDDAEPDGRYVTNVSLAFGDTNGDGIDDLAIGAPLSDKEQGAAYLVLGR